MKKPIIVCGNSSDSPLAIDIAQHLGIEEDISDLVSLKTYANGEFCPRFIPGPEDLDRIGERLKGYTVVICSSSREDRTRNDLAMRNMILARAARENGAERVILVEPDLYYSAQDRGPRRRGPREANRDVNDLKKFDGQPFTAELYAQLLKISGVDAVITVHNHSVKVQDLFNEVFGGQFHHLLPAEVYAHYITHSDFVRTGVDGEHLVLAAPDKGAEPFMNDVWNALGLKEVKRIVMAKERFGERDVRMCVAPHSELTLDQLAGRDVIVLDDMVRTGTTIVQCCEHLRTGNPRRVTFGVTHFYPSAEAREKLNTPAIDEIMTSNTLPGIQNRDQQGRLRKKIVVLKVSKWISRKILDLTGQNDGRFNRNFYSVDMSSKNPRWQQGN
jgi:ribose-phosphate pyrophosphokinase